MPDTFERLKAALADRYAIEREFGSGGMATVYLAEDLKHHRKVAVKVLRPELAAVVGAERFLNEITVTANLQHPRILGLHDSGEADGFLFYVMPFVDGESLRQRLNARKQLRIDESLRIATQVGEALEYAHRQGVLHRDIKPENILLQEEQAVVADFGIALAISAASGERLTETGMSLGTPQYMSPEQASGDRHLSPESDIYSLGCVLYEMLTGDPPHLGSTAQAILAKTLTEEPTRLSVLRDTVATAVETAVHTALAKTPADRFSSAAEFTRALMTELDQPIRAARARQHPAPVPRFDGRKRLVAGAGVLVLILLAVWSIMSRTTTVPVETILEIERFTAQGQWEQAYALATAAFREAPTDPELQQLWPSFSRPVSLHTKPPEATVYRKAYTAPKDAWQVVGTTPIDSVPVPRGQSIMRFELHGHRSALVTTDPFSSMPELHLQPDSVLSTDQVWIPGGWLADDLELGPYILGRFEVTNREYKVFVEAGGYRVREYWNHAFVRDGREVPWELAMQEFVDRTGRPGPSTWEVGDFPPGHEDYPVSGVSWYEAAAYAAFAGRDLPTTHHWRWAAPPSEGPWVLPLSNFSGDGPAPVGQYQGINRFGNVDMAGNVREWCFNARESDRFIMGGGWNDPDFAFQSNTIAMPPFDRSESNGFRVVTYLSDANLDRARADAAPHRDYTDQKPVSDEIFAGYQRLYQYDAVELSPRIEAVDTTRHWVRQKVSFEDAVGTGRMIVYLYLPKTGRTPLQTVVYLPGGGAFGLESIDDYRGSHPDFIIRSGRALLFPVFAGTFERRGILPPNPGGRASTAYRDRIFRWAKEVRQAVDFIETRADLDNSKIGYYGWSWGGWMGPMVLANEPRIKAAILETAGLFIREDNQHQPEANVINFVTRVTQPTLMLAGEYDHFYPARETAVPMFELLGTPAADKKITIEPGGHILPRVKVISETLDWLDKYLGPVN